MVAGDIPVYIAKPGNMVLTIDEDASDRIAACNYSVVTNRKPVYGLNSFLPLQVNIEYPIEISMNFTLEIDTYECEELYSLLCTPNEQNLSISFLRNCDTANTIVTYNAPNARLYSNNYAGSVNGNARAELGFKAFLR